MSELATNGNYTNDQIDLLKRTICVGSNNDEFALFVQQCKRTGLDPFAKQIHAVKRGGKMTIQVGIDGFRLIALRTGKMDGQDGPYWCGEDGIWKDVWLSKDKPAASKVTVFRKGDTRGYTGVARWVEYYQPSGGMWDKLPATMLAKVAESIALRKGFPQELSGLYTTEEMDQCAAPQVVDVRQEQPALPARGGQHESPVDKPDRDLVIGHETNISEAETLGELEAVGFVIARDKGLTEQGKAHLKAVYRKRQDYLKAAPQPVNVNDDIPN